MAAKSMVLDEWQEEQIKIVVSYKSIGRIEYVQIKFYRW